MRKLLLGSMAVGLLVASMNYICATTDNPLRQAYGMTPSTAELCRGLATLPRYTALVPFVSSTGTVVKTPRAEETAAAELLYSRLC